VPYKETRRRTANSLCLPDRPAPLCPSHLLRDTTLVNHPSFGGLAELRALGERPPETHGLDGALVCGLAMDEGSGRI
jgi:hypothetical protein